MVLFGLDVSRWQGNNPHHGHAAAQGVSFCICKSTQGNSWLDPKWGVNLAKCRAAYGDDFVAAYHYVEGSDSAASQVEWIKQHVPRTVAVIPDVEDGSGGVALLRDIVALLRAAGYRVPMIYLPRWYWQQIGSPSLAGLPPLWSSRYPDNQQGTILDEYADVPARYWDGYGGLPVAMLQFSSSGIVASYGPLDLNAFRGTKAELKQLLSGTSGGGGGTPPGIPTLNTEEYDMDLSPGQNQSRTGTVPNGAKTINIAVGFVGMNVEHVKFFGTTPESGYNQVGGTTGAQWVDPARPYVIEVPADALTVEVCYDLQVPDLSGPDAPEGYVYDPGQHHASAGFRS